MDYNKGIQVKMKYETFPLKYYIAGQDMPPASTGDDDSIKKQTSG